MERTINMTTLSKLSAAQINEQHKLGLISWEGAIGYATQKHGDLLTRKKYFRASLWEKAIEEINKRASSQFESKQNTITTHEDHPLVIAQRKRMAETEADKKARGLVCKKIQGVKHWHWPLEFWNMGFNGVNLTPTAQERGIAAVAN